MEVEFELTYLAVDRLPAPLKILIPHYVLPFERPDTAIRRAISCVGRGLKIRSRERMYPPAAGVLQSGGLDRWIILLRIKLGLEPFGDEHLQPRLVKYVALVGEQLDWRHHRFGPSDGYRL